MDISLGMMGLKVIIIMMDNGEIHITEKFLKCFKEKLLILLQVKLSEILLLKVKIKTQASQMVNSGWTLTKLNKHLMKYWQHI